MCWLLLSPLDRPRRLAPAVPVVVSTPMQPADLGRYAQGSEGAGRSRVFCHLGCLSFKRYADSSIVGQQCFESSAARSRGLRGKAFYRCLPEISFTVLECWSSFSVCCQDHQSLCPNKQPLPCGMGPCLAEDRAIKSKTNEWDRCCTASNGNQIGRAHV